MIKNIKAVLWIIVVEILSYCVVKSRFYATSNIILSFRFVLFAKIGLKRRFLDVEI